MLYAVNGTIHTAVTGNSGDTIERPSLVELDILCLEVLILR